MIKYSHRYAEAALKQLFNSTEINKNSSKYLFNKGGMKVQILPLKVVLCISI